MTQTPLRRLLLLLLLLLVAGCATDDSDGADRCAACGPGAYCNHGDCVSTSVDFPRDAGPHEMLSEWW